MICFDGNGSLCYKYTEFLQEDKTADKLRRRKGPIFP